MSGLTPYEQARQLQLRLVELRAADQIDDTVLFLEHEPVVTRGRGLQFTGVDRPRHMPMGPMPAGVAFAETERGGDLTYHGPGQLVIYPILKLDGQGFGPRHDIAGFLRRFEQVLIDVIELIVRTSGGQARGFSREGATGVWMARLGEPVGSARKIASMGVAVRKWVTYHGLAVNCVNDLAPFRLISPCGFDPEVMTRLSDWLPSGSQEARLLADWQWRGRADLERRVAAGMVQGASLGVQSLPAPEVLSLSLSSVDALLCAAAALPSSLSRFATTAGVDEAGAAG